MSGLSLNATISGITAHNPAVKSFVLDVEKDLAKKIVAGQFVMVSLPGFGEFAAGIASDPRELSTIELCIKNVGAATGALHSLKKGDAVGLRGPFGNGFDLKALEGNDLIIIAGGTGMPPLRSLILALESQRDRFGKIVLLVGAKKPQDILYKKDHKKWMKFLQINMIVEDPDAGWSGPKGLITALLEDADVASSAYVIMVGPPKMYEACLKVALKRGLKKERIYLSLERNMKCGIGKCQHCVIGEKYTCIHGPVFNYKEMQGAMPDAI